jgi:hypothetical protein
MPKGIYIRIKSARSAYVRTPEIREAARQKSLGHLVTSETREKISVAVKPIAQRLSQDLSWRKKVSEGTKTALHKPEIREKHLSGMAKDRQENGIRFRGGLSQEPTAFVKEMAKILLPAGFVQEYPVSRGIGSGKGGSYRLDFAHIEGKINIECDGPYHRSLKRKFRDEKKDLFLKSQGWKVIRVQHD